MGIDFARGTISLERIVTLDGIAEPKTAKCRRTVPILAGLRDELLRHFDWQRERNLDEAGLVFTNHEGRMLRPWTFTMRDLERTLQAAGIAKSLPLYGLRHTFATLHVSAGTPLKVVSDLLGHSNIQQTANTYMHGDHAVTSDWMEHFDRAMAAVDQDAPAHSPNEWHTAWHTTGAVTAPRERGRFSVPRPERRLVSGGR